MKKATFDQMKRARAAGKAAFHNGQKAIPCQDAACMAIIAELDSTEIGTSFPVLEAWTNSWHRENAAAPVPGM